jgi:hypothetical protein
MKSPVVIQAVNSHCGERRTDHDKGNSMGKVVNRGWGEGEEGKQVNLDGFLQQPLNRLSTAGSCYLP